MHEQRKVQAIVQQLNIIDDTLFQKMAEDPEYERCGHMCNLWHPDKHMAYGLAEYGTADHSDRAAVPFASERK